MESNHNSEQINAFQETSQSMVEMCAALAVAKAEQGEQIAKLMKKIDLLTKLVEKLLSQKPTPATTTTTKNIYGLRQMRQTSRKGNVLGGGEECGESAHELEVGKNIG